MTVMPSSPAVLLRRGANAEDGVITAVPYRRVLEAFSARPPQHGLQHWYVSNLVAIAALKYMEIGLRLSNRYSVERHLIPVVELRVYSTLIVATNKAWVTVRHGQTVNKITTIL